MRMHARDPGWGRASKFHIYFVPATRPPVAGFGSVVSFCAPCCGHRVRRGRAARRGVGQGNESLSHACARAEHARRGPGDQRCDMQLVVAWARCSIALATSVSQ